MNKSLAFAFIALIATAPIALAQGGAAPPAQDAPKPDSPKPTAPPSPEAPGELQLPPGPKALAPDWAAADTDAAALTKAEALIAKMTKAYQDAPTLADTIKLSSKTPFGEQSDTLGVAFAGPDLRLESGQMSLSTSANTLYFETESSTKKYLAVPIKESVDATLKELMPGFKLPVPYRELRAGATGADLYKGFSLGVLEDLKPVGMRQKDGKDQILMRAANGDMQVTIDPATSLISGIETVFSPPQAPPGMMIGVDMAMAPKLGPSLEKPITAPEPKGRRAVTTMQELMAATSAGEPAMDFTLSDQDGKKVSLADLKGNVVVLDFWASWCVPCQRGLPKLDEVAKWAAESGSPVKIFGVNVWEKVGKEERQNFASTFWAGKKFSFPTLVDAEDSLVKSYGFQAIPVTVVIGLDGNVAALHEGADPEMVAKLKTDIEKALAAKPATR